MRRLSLLLLLMASASSLRAADPAPVYARRWVWIMTNLMVEKETDRVIGLVERMAKDGYNGVVISDYKFSFLDRMPDHYFKNVERLKAAAKGAGVEIIPGVFPIGYSNSLLTNDANLAEGMPVVDAPFVVKAREATLVPDPAARLTNGDLEAVKAGDIFAGFGYQDAPGKSTFVDRQVFHHGKSSCRMDHLSETDNCRFITPMKVRPHTAYRLSAWVKTKDLASRDGFRLMANGGSGKTLSFFENGVQPTQDWKRIEVVFNSQDETSVKIYAGIWGGKSGTLWIDEITVEELSMVNVLRRPGCPLKVTSADGKTVYEEGRDFEPVADPILAKFPYEGDYNFEHAPARLRLTARGRIKDGDRLHVSWYHPVLVLGEYTMCCPSEPKTYTLLREQAKRIEALFHPRTIFMQHDEIRVMNWCAACRARNLTPGQILADNARRCSQILAETSPKATVVVWSDMFDPTHNAVPGPYYLVNGSLLGSWEGLDPKVIIANWNGGKPRTSLEFFAKRGHEQVIAGYYDSDDNFATWDAAAKGIKGVVGFMYTTWQKRFDDLERYAKLIRRK